MSHVFLLLSVLNSSFQRIQFPKAKHTAHVYGGIKDYSTKEWRQLCNSLKISHACLNQKQKLLLLAKYVT